MFNGESFGSICPDNWAEIVDYLNDILETKLEDGMDERDAKELMEEIWDCYCSGALKGAPEQVFKDV